MISTEKNVQGDPIPGPRGRRWFPVILILLVILGIGSIGFQVIRFLNLRADLTLDPATFSRHSPLAGVFPSGSSTEVPFTQGLGFPEPLSSEDESSPPLDLELENVLYSDEAEIPGSFSELLRRIPSSTEFLKEIVSRTEVSLASLPQPLIGSEPLLPGKADLEVGGLSETARFWSFLAIAHIGKAQPMDLVKVLLGVALIRAHIEAMDCPNPTLMTSMVGIITNKIAGHGMVLSAPGLRLSKAEILYVIEVLEKLESRRVPFRLFLQTELELTRAIRKSPGSMKSLPFPKGIFRWPGHVLHEIANSPDMVRFVEEDIYGSLIRMASEPWVATHPELVRRGLEAKEARRLLKGNLPGIFWRFGFRPKSFYKTWVVSAGGLIPSSIRTQDEAAAQVWDMVTWALALSGFRAERKAWPRAPNELEEWLGRTLPQDRFSYGPVIFCPGDPPDIRSIGPDQAPYTGDDLLAVATGAASLTAYVESLK